MNEDDYTRRRPGNQRRKYKEESYLDYVPNLQKNGSDSCGKLPDDAPFGKQARCIGTNNHTAR